MRNGGGHLELRTGKRDASGHPVIAERPVVRIAPLYGRLVVFEIGSKSYHGHPDPTTCPPDIARCSLATYYFTREAPADVETKKRRALFWPRPGFPEDTPENRAWCLERAAFRTFNG